MKRLAGLCLLLGSLSLPAIACAVPPVSFAPHVDYATGVNSNSVAIGDLNRDGKPDLAVSIYSGVSVLLGDGAGGFGPKTDFAAGSLAFFVVIGDFNGDGKPDLAVANLLSNTVSVLLGNGAGSFGPKTDYATGTNPRYLAIGDLNGDGKPDLAAANGGSGTVSVLLGNGDGSFGPHSDLGAGTGPLAVAIADLNGDGKLDLVATHNADVLGGHDLFVFLGNGDGTFGSPTAFPNDQGPYSVALADLNGDGKLDIVSANHFARSVAVFLGRGDGSFMPAVAFGNGEYVQGVAIGDLNGDGEPDLAVTNGGESSVTNTVSVLLGNGDGTFGSPTAFATGGYDPSSVAIADLNRDGKLDLVIATFQSNPGTVSVLINTSTLLGVDTTVPRMLSLSVAPNPSWNPVLLYDVPHTADVRLDIFDLNGRQVSGLRHEVMAPGRYSQPWSGSADGGHTARPGLYFARLTVGKETRSATIAFLK